MPRDRKNKQDNWMPARVYRGRKHYEFHPPGGGSKSLCPLDASEAQVWEAYRRTTSGENEQITVKVLSDKYFASDRFLQCKPKTQKSYLENWRVLERVFGQMDCKAVTSVHVREFMDERGKKAKVSANREKALLSAIFGYAKEYGHAQTNPCVGVRSFSERGRQETYIEDDEYQRFLTDSDDIVKVFMELSYLLAARGQDVRKITLDDLRKDGIYIVQAKTGKKQLKRWTERLRQIVDLALKVREKRLEGKPFHANTLIVTQTGEAYSESALKSLWQRNKTRVLKKWQERSDASEMPTIAWTYHDIKAKGISDYIGDKQAFSGHKSHAMMERYNRSPDEVDSLDKPANAI